MRRIYELLLRLYPLEIHATFAAEMSTVFELAAEDRRAQGRLAYIRFVFAELSGLATGVFRVRLGRPAASLDLRKMRPPGVSRETYTAALDEVIEARRRVQFNQHRLQEALFREEFVKANLYSEEDRKARRNLLVVQRRYRIAD